MSKEICIQNYEKMIKKIAFKYHNMTGYELEELISECIVYFYKAIQNYNSKKAEFSTYLYICLNGFLKSFLKKEKRNYYINKNLFYLNELYSIDQEKKEKIPNDVKKIIEILLTKKEDLLKFGKSKKYQYRKITKQMIFLYLKEHGWDRTMIENAFNKIKYLLKENLI